MRIVAMLLLMFSYTLHAEKNSLFDQTLADKLGADELGMKTYMMVILVSGKQVELTDKQRADAFNGHFSNMGKLAEQNKLVVAGPFVDAKPKRGLFIFNTNDMAEAEQWVKTDPAVMAGIFDYEIYEIYSSAALMLINDYHPKIAKKAVN